MDRRPGLDEPPRGKRLKTSSTNMDPKTNPYLAHMYQETSDDDEDTNSEGYQRSANGMFEDRMNGVPLYPTPSNPSSLSRFPRHATNASMARAVEDGPNNPFNGKPLSKEYFNILKIRRNLPVHAQR